MLQQQRMCSLFSIMFRALAGSCVSRPSVVRVRTRTQDRVRQFELLIRRVE
jgi:hypothetical protein